MRLTSPSRIFAVVVMLISMTAMQIAYAACHCKEMFGSAPATYTVAHDMVRADSTPDCHHAGAQPKEPCTDNQHVEKRSVIAPEYPDFPRFIAGPLVQVVGLFPSPHVISITHRPASVGSAAAPTPPHCIHHCSFQL